MVPRFPRKAHRLIDVEDAVTCLGRDPATLRPSFDGLRTLYSSWFRNAVSGSELRRVLESYKREAKEPSLISNSKVFSIHNRNVLPSLALFSRWSFGCSVEHPDSRFVTPFSS